MGAIQVTALTPGKKTASDDKVSLADLLNRLPLGSTLRPALILYGGQDEPTRCWEVKHEKLNFWTIRDTPEEAIRAFVHAVDKRGLRPYLEGSITVSTSSQSLHEQNSLSKPAVL
jgi:hypothetical protein